MSQNKTSEMVLKGLCCANCAAVIEDKVNKLPWVSEARVNLATQILTLDTGTSPLKPDALEEIQVLVNTVENGVVVGEKAAAGAVRPEEARGTVKGSLVRRLPEIAGALLFAFLMITKSSLVLPGAAEPLLFLAAYLLIGRTVLLSALRNIRHGRVMDENFLMVIATVGAFAIREFPEAVAVMLFYQVGEYFQGRAVDRSRRSIRNLLDSRPGSVFVLHEGQTVETPPEEVVPGTVFLVRPGDRIPLDGVVLKGNGSVDTSALTGESYPRSVEAGTAVLSGFVNRESPLEIESTRSLEESAYSRIIRMVEESSGRKARSEQFITRFARYYTPAVVFSALIMAVLPPLLVPGALFSDWIYRALVFLVVSCPCALVVSIPLSFFAGIGTASKNGILVKGGNYLEALNRIDTVVLDKTGTLTKGVFRVSALHPAEGVSEDHLLHQAAAAETHSTHPIAESIRQAWKERSPVISLPDAETMEEIAGQGLHAVLEGRTITLGRAGWVSRTAGAVPEIPEAAGTVIHAAEDGRYLGAIVLSDEMRSDSADLVRNLRREGIGEVVMLTGDGEKTASAVAEELGLTDYRAELLPEEKVSALEEMIARGRRTAFAGDGINDAPVLARADVGIAMGGLGADAAIEAADIVLMSDEPSRIVTARRIARRTRRIVVQNIVMALGIKAAVLVLAAMGIAGMGLAVFADVGVALLAVLNAMRVMMYRE